MNMEFEMMDASILILKPKQPLIDWVNGLLIRDDLPPVTMDTYDDECGPMTYLIPDFEELSKAKRWLKKHYLLLFEEILEGWALDEEDWPADLSYKAFTKWVEPQFNLMVTDLRDLH